MAVNEVRVLLNDVPSGLESYVTTTANHSNSSVYYGMNGNSYYIKGGKVYQDVYGTISSTASGSTKIALDSVPSDVASFAIDQSKADPSNTFTYTSDKMNDYEIKDGKVSLILKGTPVSGSTSTTTSARGGKQVVTNVSAPSSSTTSTSSGDVKGIDEAGITAIKTAIQDFVKGYSSKVSNVGTTTATIQKAVRGTASEKAISNLSSAINSSVMQSLNKLNTFADQLDTVKSSYVKADSSNTSVSTYTNEITNS